MAGAWQGHGDGAAKARHVALTRDLLQFGMSTWYCALQPQWFNDGIEWLKEWSLKDWIKKTAGNVKVIRRPAIGERRNAVSLFVMHVQRDGRK